MKKIILHLIIMINLFSLDEVEKKIIKEIESENYSCIPEKRTVKIKGENFIGHIDYEGKFHGELEFLSGFSKGLYCILDDKYKIYLPEDNWFYLYNSKLNTTIIKNNKYDLYQYIGNDGIIFLFERKSKEYIRKFSSILIVPPYKVRGGSKTKEEFFENNKLIIDEKNGLGE